MKDHKFTTLQQRVYDSIMNGKDIAVAWPVAAGKTYLCNAIREDLAAIGAAAKEHFKDEYMEVTVEVASEEFGEEVTEETMKAVVQNILDRYCSPEYFSQEELEAIRKNDF